MATTWSRPSPQDWVHDNKVGMVGLSIPGSASCSSPVHNRRASAAITPLSVMDDTMRELLSPEVASSTRGFALTWADEVLTKAEPYGQGWEQALVDEGDTICEQNQENCAARTST